MSSKPVGLLQCSLCHNAYFGNFVFILTDVEVGLRVLSFLQRLQARESVRPEWIFSKRWRKDSLQFAVGLSPAQKGVSDSEIIYFVFKCNILFFALNILRPNTKMKENKMGKVRKTTCLELRDYTSWRWFGHDLDNATVLLAVTSHFLTVNIMPMNLSSLVFGDSIKDHFSFGIFLTVSNKKKPLGFMFCWEHVAW